MTLLSALGFEKYRIQSAKLLHVVTWYSECWSSSKSSGFHISSLSLWVLYGFCSALVTCGEYRSSSDSGAVQQRMLMYLKKGMFLKCTGNLIIWVVGLTLTFTDFWQERKLTFIMWLCVHLSQYTVFNPSNNHIFTSEKTDSENEISWFKIYSPEVRRIMQNKGCMTPKPMLYLNRYLSETHFTSLTWNTDVYCEDQLRIMNDVLT